MDEVNVSFEWADKGMSYRPNQPQGMNHQPQTMNHQPQRMNHQQQRMNHVMMIHQPEAVSQGFPVQSVGVWMLTRALVPSLAILTGVAAAVYFFYKRFIEPFFIGSESKSKSKDPLVIVTDSVDRVTHSVDSLKQSLTTFEENIKRSVEDSVGKVMVEVTGKQTGSHPASSHDMAVLKKEIQSLKGLLLSRNQFPESPIVSFIQQTSAAVDRTSAVNGSADGGASVAQLPSIPSWQLTDESKEEELKERQ